MYGFGNDLTLNGPASAPANSEPSTSNAFAFPGYFQPFSLYNQFNQSAQLPSIPSPATINNLAASFQQQTFNSGFTALAMNTAISPDLQFFQQPNTSIQTGYSSAFNWPQPQWPNTFQNSYDLTNAYATTIKTLTENQPQTSSASSAPPCINTKIPTTALQKTVVLLKRQDIYTQNWTNKTCDLYFRKWIDSTFNISENNIERSYTIINTDYIIAFLSLDLQTANYLINLFADGKPREDVLLKTASKAMIEMMRAYKQQTGSAEQISSIEDAFAAVFHIKKQQQQPMSAPPLYPYIGNSFGQV